MELILPEGEQRRFVEHDMSAAPGCKFAMLRRGRSCETLLFPRSLTHAHVAGMCLDQDDKLEFIGAGWVENGVPRWGSESCEERFGTDRPEGAAREARLKELRSALAEL
jgi:hypothetical protein